MALGPSLAFEVKVSSSKFTAQITPSNKDLNLANVYCKEIFNFIQKIPCNKASGGVASLHFY